MATNVVITIIIIIIIHKFQRKRFVLLLFIKNKGLLGNLDVNNEKEKRFFGLDSIQRGKKKEKRKNGERRRETRKIF